MLKTTAWMLALTSLTCWNAMATNLVSNPDFESGASGSYVAGSSDLSGWTVDTTPSDGVQLQPANIVNAIQTPNTKVLQLTGGGGVYSVGGGVQQTIATETGVTYAISIDVASRQNNSVTGNFSFGGQDQSISASSNTFTTLTWTVTATSSSTLIDITGSTTSGSAQFLIDNVTVSLLSGPVSAANSTVAAAPATVLADGTSTSTITVTLLDASDLPVAGKTVTLAQTSGPGTPAINPASKVTNGTGVATFTVASATVGEAVFTATDVTDGNLVITQTATVNFFADAPITWGTGTTIANDTDVSTVGTLKYAYHWGAGDQTVNGVTFTGTTSFTGGGSDVGLSGFAGQFGAFTGTTTPFIDLSSAYQATLAGSPAIFTGSVVNASVTLNNLTPGNNYAVQVWSQDARGHSGYLLSATLSSIGGNSVTLDYNSTNADGGVGQYTIGTFTADAATQTFTISSTYPLLNALQVRDVSAVDDYAAWSGPSGYNLANGPAGDDDNDGITNQEEYAFGLIPNSGASVNPITVQLNKSAKTFSYTRRDTSKTDLNYSVWFSTDLSGWTQDTGATEGTPVLNGEVETVEVTLSTLPGDPLPTKLFIQVRAN